MNGLQKRADDFVRGVEMVNGRTFPAHIRSVLVRDIADAVDAAFDVFRSWQVEREELRAKVRDAHRDCDSFESCR